MNQTSFLRGIAADIKTRSENREDVQFDKMNSTNPTETSMKTMGPRCTGMYAIPTPHVAFVVLLVLQTQWQVTNGECGIRRITCATNPVISHEWGM
jgi:hypothetical protein